MRASSAAVSRPAPPAAFRRNFWDVGHDFRLRCTHAAAAANPCVADCSSLAVAPTQH